MSSRVHVFLCVLIVGLASAVSAAEFKLQSRPLVWEQTERSLKFYFFTERELYTSLDRTVRMVFAAEGANLSELVVRWTISKDGSVFARGSTAIEQGGADVTFPVSQLQPGRYSVAAQLVQGESALAEKSAVLRYELRDAPAASGTINLLLPRGMPLKDQTWPVHAGVPFPKGALWNAGNVRVVDAAGKEMDADVTVRSRWDSGEQGSIRWLGVMFQPGTAQPSWPEGLSQYKIEYGAQVNRNAPRAAIKATSDAEGVSIDTGAATLRIVRKSFNVIDQWSAGGVEFKSSRQHGLYLVDHEGAIYRAANDRAVDLKIEEQSAMHVVVRAAGWYVKDEASDPPTQDFKLPTDKLCRFITRIEAYAGKPYVRVTNTLIVTFDTFNVRLRDAGMSLPIPGVSSATFGVEDAKPQAAKVEASGVRGVQHLHNAFTVEDGTGKSLAEAKHSAGWVIAAGRSATLALSLRDTWQRYPKELEVLPDALKLHVWPAHGREHPQIDQLARNQMHRLLFAHQGSELNLATPWDYYFKACEYYGADNAGGVNHVLAAVQSTGMGVATTSDCLIELGNAGDETKLADNAACFQLAPHAVADPKWNCDSLAMGYMNPYDPRTFPSLEQVIQDCMRGYWQYQDMGEMFGMWIYRSWLHSQYSGDGAWELYRLYNGSHHHEAIIPWLLYARSGDPFYLTQGSANIRQFTDVQMIHHADPRYPHKEDSQQHPVVGSTKHDNCIVPWGRDHGIMGHMVCYNAPITAYYLTGDLRLREVVVDEWLHTLVGDRLNPWRALTDLSNTVFPENPRNNSVAISEVIDAYQLTYDPRLLVYLAPRFDVWTTAPGDMGSDWAQPLHHEVLFRGSETVREKLTAGVAAQRSGESWKDKAIVRPLHAVHEMFALEGILEPQKLSSVEAFNHVSHEYLQTYSWNRITGKKHDVFCNTGDFVLFLPRMMYALEHSAFRDRAPVLGAARSAARTTTSPTRVVVREDVDAAFKIYLNGEVKQEKGFDIQVFDPAGALVAREHVGTGKQTFEMTVPSDGKTGQYVLFVGARQNDAVFAPFTSLPEVYCHTYWTGNNDAQRYFTRSADDKSFKLTASPQRAPGTILARDQKTELANTEAGEEMAVNVGPDGVWIWNRACYITTFRDGDQPVILAITPQRWFMPNDTSLAVKPAP